MAELEKVIEALEQCREGNPSCDGCPYDIKSAKCLFLLHSDALELLKEQKEEIDRVKRIAKEISTVALNR